MSNGSTLKRILLAKDCAIGKEFLITAVVNVGWQGLILFLMIACLFYLIEH